MTSRSASRYHMNIAGPTEDTLAVQIHPDDADQAFVAGVQFARALAGAEGGAFMVALGEQAALVQSAIATVGFSSTKARLAAEAFEAGIQVEWRRIASPERPMMWGTA